MYCKTIKAENFRNIEECKVDFSEGVNILVGENAQGKTNLLEAVFYSSVGRSFRASPTSEMIRFGQSAADIELSYRDSKRDQKLHIKILFCLIFFYMKKARLVNREHLPKGFSFHR